MHVISIDAAGWTLTCPPTCGDADACEVRRAASQLAAPPCTGRHPCWVEDGRLVVSCGQSVWLDSDRLDPALLPHSMSTSVDRTSADEVEHPALLRDRFHPWR
jgi:hypothetical protein